MIGQVIDLMPQSSQPRGSFNEEASLRWICSGTEACIFHKGVSIIAKIDERYHADSLATLIRTQAHSCLNTHQVPSSPFVEAAPALMEIRAANTNNSTNTRLKTYTPAPIHKEDTRKVHCVNKHYEVSENYFRSWPHLPKGVKASRPFIVSKLSL